MNRVDQLIELYNSKKTDRVHLNSLWQEVAEVLDPDRVGFIGQSPEEMGRTDERVFDSNARIAKRGLTNAIGSMMRPKSSANGAWFNITIDDDDAVMEDRAAKEWIEMAEKKMWRHLYNPKAQFIQASGEVDDDLVTYGTGIGYLGLRQDRRGAFFKSFHLKNSYLVVDGHNNTNGIIITEKFTATQAAGHWGEENLGKKTIEALKSPTKQDREKKFEFLWFVMPRADRDPRFPTSRNMPFTDTVVDVESKHIVIDDGFEEFPFFAPRWDTRSGEIYGRGPGIMALPDTQTLQSMGKTMLRMLHRAVDPPLLMPSDSMVNAPEIFPGGVSYYNAKAISNLGLNQPFIPLQTGAQIPWGLDAQTRTTEIIFSIFFRNILNLPVEGPEMTATEVVQRREEFVREIGPVFGRLESAYNGTIIDRLFNMMTRAGQFGDPNDIPEVLQGRRVSFRFASPVERAKQQIEEAQATEAINRILAIGEIQPEAMDAVDWTEAGKFILESNGVPTKLILDERAIGDKQQQRAQAAAQQQQMDTMGQAAAVGQQVGDAAASLEGSGLV